MRPDNDKRWQTALTCVAGGFAGAWLGYTLYEAWDWLVARPELYAAYSAPWYTGPLLLAGQAARFRPDRNPEFSFFFLKESFCQRQIFPDHGAVFLLAAETLAGHRVFRKKDQT